jgi:hypothetical protein
MDIYREHIAEELGKAAGIDPELIFSRLAWTNTLDKGDLSLPVCSSIADLYLAIATMKKLYHSHCLSM